MSAIQTRTSRLMTVALTSLLWALGIPNVCVAQEESARQTLDTSTSSAARDRQHSEATHEQGICREQADLILEELRQIRRLMEKQQIQLQQAFVPSAPVSEKVRFRIEDDWHAIGSDDAPVTLVEFTDLQCMFCRRFHADTFPQIKKNYIDTGKVRFVSRDLPLDFHPYAEKAAESARCAGDQGRFWEMRNLVLETTDTLNDDSILNLASYLKLDLDKFRLCLGTSRYKVAIQNDSVQATTLNITGTPTFVLGRSTTGTLEGTRMVGLQSFSAFQAKIEDLLEKGTSADQ